ncbi:unnamed protein product [Euphydryas editha]|uniref:Uncharacterized protein n=1 Tax=Euphydryas editha TaxID=104508 RepID=A0AAU9TR21_EUPED|nr:unnamed protein product [Euphydryas editha]
MRTLSDDVVSDLYLKYVEAVSDDKSNISSRRLFKNDKQYEIHIKKLKEVNGFKVHNLMVKENLRTDANTLIYINNPVESKIPKAFLSLEEFKNVLTNRVIKQRDELTDKKRINLSNRNYNKTSTKNQINVTKLNKLKPGNVVHKKNNKLTTKMVLLTNAVEPVASEAKINTFTTETVMTKFYTNLTNKLKEKEPIHDNKKQLEESNIETSRFFDEILVTTTTLDVFDRIINKTKDITISSSTTDIEKELIRTTLENVTEKYPETTDVDLSSSITDKKTQEISTDVIDNTDLFTTDVKTLGEETVETEQPTTEKEKPRRKSTTKLSINSEASKKNIKQGKRSTLGVSI